MEVRGNPHSDGADRAGLEVVSRRGIFPAAVSLLLMNSRLRLPYSFEFRSEAKSFANLILI
jgi:hypothetical protein